MTFTPISIKNLIQKSNQAVLQQQDALPGTANLNNGTAKARRHHQRAESQSTCNALAAQITAYRHASGTNTEPLRLTAAAARIERQGHPAANADAGSQAASS